MIIKTRQGTDVRPSEITSEALFRDRRRFIQSAAAAGVGLAAGSILKPRGAAAGLDFANVSKSAHVVEGELTDYDLVTGYNNFYEFGLSKTDPAKYAGDLVTDPWTIAVEGEVANTGTYDVEDLIRPNRLEERVYRLRCVETWSMVVPWVGVPLGDVIRRLEPTSRAKYVAFETLFDPEQMPGQLIDFVDWPYQEGLRMDEALNPLTLLVVGLYGKVLPNQNGAPIRLMAPWKYGFKNIKSIVRMKFVEKQPETSWNVSQPDEYGFYANVNPEVDHPRWSQAKERKIGDTLFTPKQKTLMFNGYADQVASLYAGMDLSEHF